jgi:hypothetical protein
MLMIFELYFNSHHFLVLNIGPLGFDVEFIDLYTRI